MIFAHKIALDLTQAQEAYCRKAAGTARLTYNWGLAEWARQYHAGQRPTATKLKQQWKQMLNIDIEIQGVELKIFSQRVSNKDYWIATAAWWFTRELRRSARVRIR